MRTVCNYTLAFHFEIISKVKLIHIINLFACIVVNVPGAQVRGIEFESSAIWKFTMTKFSLMSHIYWRFVCVGFVCVFNSGMLCV